MQFLERKLSIPVLPSSFLSRPRLLERLDEWRRKHLTLILAPAGSGKTTLLSEWAFKREQKARVVWISLGREDNDPYRFWQYMVASIGPMANKELDGWLQNSTAPSVDDIETFINWIHQHVRQEFMLVLDDYHVINSPEINDSVSYLLDYLPANMRIAIISRSQPPLPIAQMRARDQLLELTRDDLKFTFEETGLYLELFGLKKLSPGEIERLNSRAEGWAVGLQIAALCLHDLNPGTLQDFLDHFTGAHYVLDEYFLEQIFRKQGREVQDFLVSTSVLERFNKPLCMAVTGMPNSGEILDRLERDNLFLVRLDNTREWYRYHHLFLDFLKNKLHGEHMDQYASLHGRAAVWFEEAGYLEAAMEHALDAGEADLANRIIQKVEVKLWGRNEIKTLGRWFNTLPMDFVKSRTDLYCGLAWAIALSDDLERLPPFIAGMKTELQNHGVGKIQPNNNPTLTLQETHGLHSAISFQCYVDLLQAYHALYQGRMREAFPFLKHALELIAENDRCWEKAVALFYMGQYLFWNYELNEAITTFTAAAQVSRKLGHHIVHISSLSNIAAIHVMLGKSSLAEQYYQESFEYLANINTEIFTAGNYFGLNDIRFARNQLEEAAKDADHYLHLSEGSGRTVDLIIAHIGISQLGQYSGDMVKARIHLEKAHQLALHRNVFFYEELVRLYQVRLGLVIGDMVTVTRWVNHYMLDGRMDSPYLNELQDLTFARFLLAEHKIKDALELLRKILEEAQAGGRNGIVLDVMALLSLAHQECGSQDLACETLGELILKAEPEGHVRLFINEGNKMRALLLETLRREPRLLNDASIKRFINQVLDAFESFVKYKAPVDGLGRIPRTNAKDAPIERLSGREVQVLRLIADGKSYENVADELIVALSTIQWHVKNIYRKLNAHSGTEAVAIARKLGILSE